MTDELPPGWALTTVGAVCPTTQYGYTASASQIECGPRFLRITDIQDGAVNWDGVPFCEIAEREVEKYAIASGDLLVARTGGTVGKSFLISYVPEPTVFASYLIRISPASEIAPDYLYYFFQSASYWQQIGLKKGGLLGNVNATTLASIEFPLCPKPEQQRIVSKIDELFSRIDEGERALEGVQKLVERYRQSVLKAAVTGELTRDWREKNKDRLESGEALLVRILKARREAWEKAELDKMKAKGITPANDKWKQKYEEPSGPETSGLPKLPGGWVWTTLGLLTRELDQGWSPQCESIPVSSDGNEWGVIKTTAIQAMRYDGDANKALPDSLEPRPGLEVQPGDILVTRAGPRTRVGISCLVRVTRPRLMICDKVYRLRVFDDLVLNDYVEVALNSPLLLRELEKLKSGISDSGLNLTQERFLALAVPLPPAGEQLRIVDAVAEAVSQGENAAIQSSVRSDSLRQAILKLAFCGQLVGQQPDEEPASILLERVAAESIDAPAKPKRGRKPKTSEPA